MRNGTRGGVALMLLVAALVAAPAAAQTCAGDCNGDGGVAINELIIGVNVALGNEQASRCPSFDRNDDGQVGIAELVAAVGHALDGCPMTATPTPVATATPIPVEGRCAVAPGEGVSFDPGQPFCELLSSYRFFVDGGNQVPNAGVLPYDLNTALFSDFAVKHRFVWMPQGVSATYEDLASFEFPVGTVLIKTFAYPYDFRDPALGERLIETRLLVRRPEEWDVVTYLWNDEETEARRRVIGAGIDVSFIDESGAERGFRYQVPNTNQCRECHEEVEGVLGPVGPKARHLNRDLDYGDAVSNQLTRWGEVGYLSGAPAPAEAPRNAVFDDPSSGTLEERARAYLDVNCGNCHNPSGLARTSGLFLTIDIEDELQLGICKGPVAAGQGSGGRPFDITPGEPDDSILVYRMEETKPGVAMPELGRVTVDDEGVQVQRDWIAAMEGSCEQP